MDRLFPMTDLRTLVARALQAGSYRPAESKRVRAVPDMRTIRYYTTLGLIDRPTEMIGRTAMYSEIHVLQLVAIKRLQAEHQTLSDIQTQLFGATPKQLRAVARLPADFWEVAERYLAQSRVAKLAPAATPAEPEREYWAQPAALPGSDPASTAPTAPAAASAAASPLASCLRLALHPTVQMIIDGFRINDERLRLIDAARLQAAAAPLLKELARQGLLNSSPPDLHAGSVAAPTPHSPHDPDPPRASKDVP